jgi:phosphoglycolate phosphatase
MPELVIFDADGVLFESRDANIAYYNAILARIGDPPLSAQEEDACVFLSAGQVFEMRAKGDKTRVQRMQEVLRSLDFGPFFKLLRPPFELRPFLLDLKRRHRVALATNRAATVPALVEYLNLSGVFDAVASALDQVRPKPAPDILTLCLERAGVPADKSVYIGDSEVDLKAADAAGVGFIGVGSGVEHPNRIARLADLPDMLDRLWANGARR